jgi:hypothetical protein
MGYGEEGRRSGQPPRRLRDVHLFVLELGEQVSFELVEGIADGA